VAWWEDLNINALEISKGLWEQTHPKPAAADNHQPNEDSAKTAPKADGNSNTDWGKIVKTPPWANRGGSH
jgi:hypothetical protein